MPTADRSSTGTVVPEGPVRTIRAPRLAMRRNVAGMVTSRFERAIAAIDAANAEDPHQITVRGRTGPKEILHAELVTEWVRDLAPDAGEELLLAARGHHLRRWTVPRASAPAGRSGYLRWRKNLHEQHATELGAILTEARIRRDHDRARADDRPQARPRTRSRGPDPRGRAVPRVPRDAARRDRGPPRAGQARERHPEDGEEDESGRTRGDRARPARRRRPRAPRTRGRTGGTGAPLPRRTRAAGVGRTRRDRRTGHRTHRPVRRRLPRP